MPNEYEELTLSEVAELAISHERALFGYKDASAVKYVPGLLARVDDLPTKKQMWVALGVISAFFVIIIAKQYGLIGALAGILFK